MTVSVIIWQQRHEQIGVCKDFELEYLPGHDEWIHVMDGWPELEVMRNVLDLAGKKPRYWVHLEAHDFDWDKFLPLARLSGWVELKGVS
jgi:hypothetical protein